MAGSIFGLGMSQRVDLNGKPAVGWLLYVYAANSSTPSDTYQDTGLTVLNSWPITADGNGMMPPFWLADGSYRVRGTSADGSITYFDQQDLLALGASSGSSPGGGVDQTTIFNTGDVMWQDVAGTRSGWVRDNGRTLGSATSGASERANADCQALFEFLWNNFTNTQCPVSSGRGVSALADWSANKTITLPDKRGYVVGGLDDMGNSAASRWTGAVGATNSTTPGGQLGETVHTLTQGEMPSHGHTASSSDSGHFHTANQATSQGASGVSGGPVAGASFQNGTNTGEGFANITTTIGNTGGGGSHNNVQLTVLGTFYRKL